MALGITPVRQVRDTHGNQQVTVTDVTLDASYAAGGVVVTALQLGLTFVQAGISVNLVTPLAATGTIVDGVVLPQIDGSIKLKLNAVAGEIANASNAAAVLRLVVAGY